MDLLIVLTYVVLVRIPLYSINRELNFFYRFLTRFFAAFHCRGIFPQGLSLKDHSV
ncbi:hypothetical protein ACM0UE_002170 [Shigella sonnei]